MLSTPESGTAALVRLDDPDALDRSLVGSKVAHLATLRQAGLPVPPGVVVTHPALRPGADIPADLVEHVFEIIGDVPLAVRSSGIAEDLADASYAGQYESVLDVRGHDAVVEAIGRCVASAGSERVAAYAGADRDRSMAVLIQPMVRAEAAGVAFSANPVSGARDEVIIDAVRGLGDRLAAGEVTPDSWLVRDGAARQVGGGDAIGPEMALEIGRMARRVEAHFGRPQDIEWAVEGDRVIVLQARPITALPEEPVEPIPIPIVVPDGFWEHDASHAPSALYPIDSFVGDVVSAGVRNWSTEFGYLFDGIEFCDIGGWVYQRMRPVGGKDGPELPRWLLWLLVRTMPVMRQRIAAAREAVRTDKAGRYIRRWREEWLPELDQSIRTLQSVDRAALSDAGLEEHLDDVLALLTRGIEIHALVHGSLAPILYEFVTACRSLLGWEMAEALRLVNGTSFKSTEPARRLHELTRLAAERPTILDVARVPDAEALARLELIDPQFADRFRAYVEVYGHRSMSDSVADQTIAERPTLLLETIRGQLDQGFDPDAIDTANQAARDAALERARSVLGVDTDAQRRFERLLDRAREAYPAREDNEFFTLSAPLALIRYGVLELGERLAARGVIEQRDDVMFLHLDEARSGLSEGRHQHDLVRRRKGQRAWAVQNPGPPSYGKPSPVPESLAFLPADARLPMESMLWSLESVMAIGDSKTRRSTGSDIAGTPVSGGTYTGTARIIHSDREFHKLRPGDVLVCPITSPVWSVLFPSIGALVTDSGGVLSHPAIIAREYRIPAVVATGNATEVLADGQLVTVDGSAGTVTAQTVA